MSRYTFEERKIIDQALTIINRKHRRGTASITSPDAAKEVLKLKLAEETREVFGVVFLDSQNRFIHDEIMFRGTLDSCPVYVREIASAALKHNAKAVMLYHNHPSGIPTPSTADIKITERIKVGLELIDVKILDHIIIGEWCESFAELGHL